jgi:chromosome segregation ATPase
MRGVSAQTLRRWLARRFHRSVEWRIEAQLRPFAERLDAELRRIDGRLDELTGRLDHIHHDLRWTAGEVERLIPHVASQESQLESLREKLSAVPASDSGQVAEARTLIDAVRREHAQIRVRLTAIARYEERLRALEDGGTPN